MSIIGPLIFIAVVVVGLSLRRGSTNTARTQELDRYFD